MTSETFKLLVEKLRRQQLAPEEHSALMEAIHQGHYDALLKELLLQNLKNAPTDAAWTKAYEHGLLQSILDKDSEPAVSKVRFLKITWLKYAAAIVVIFTAAFIWFKLSDASQLEQNTQAAHNTIPPGKNKATLTLSDGRIISLDDASSGKLASDGGAEVIKSKGDEIIYADGAVKADGNAVYNVMATPRGGQYHLKLPDGSKVWLNAESSIRFPVSFRGKERTVMVSGEAYLEIARDPSRPFKVHADSLTIDVLGTSFNINTYNDDGNARTTLVDGAVKINFLSPSENMVPVVLKPGQQLVYNKKESSHTVVNKAEINQVLAWKNGRFSFNGNIRQVMKEVARWYNIELQYSGHIPLKELEGGFTRTMELQKTLEILEAVAGVKFELNGRLLTVSGKDK